MIKINVVTPHGEVVNEETDFLVARTDTGEIGFLENHTPLIARISKGYIRYNNKYVAINSGVIDVNNNVINIVCQYASAADTIDEAQKDIEDFQNQKLRESKRKMVDFAQAEKELVKNIKKVGASNLK